MDRVGAAATGDDGRDARDTTFAANGSHRATDPPTASESYTVSYIKIIFQTKSTKHKREQIYSKGSHINNGQLCTHYFGGGALAKIKFSMPLARFCFCNSHNNTSLTKIDPLVGLWILI